MSWWSSAPSALRLASNGSEKQLPGVKQAREPLEMQISGAPAPSEEAGAELLESEVGGVGQNPPPQKKQAQTNTRVAYLCPGGVGGATCARGPPPCVAPQNDHFTASSVIGA